MSLAPNDYGLVIAGHGSRDSEGLCEFKAMIEQLRQKTPQKKITYGFLEFNSPTIDEAVRENIQSGSKKVIILPAILLAATHAKNDMPSEVLALQREFPKVTLQYGAALHLHPLLLELCRERIIEAEAKSKKVLRRDESCLVIVGRGTTDSDANSDVSKLARMLEEGLGFGASFVCYSGTAKPEVREGLQLAAKLGFQRLIILPFMLFTGVLVKRIYAAADALSARNPELEILKCDYLGVHEKVANALLERAQECWEGSAAMNCSLCKYRVQIVGYENEVGTPQMGHHFHVRGVQAKNDSDSNALNQTSNHLEPRHPIEQESFKLIEQMRDWSPFGNLEKQILQRLVHTSGDVEVVKDIFISSGATEALLKGIHRKAPIVTDVTMVQSGLRRSLLNQLCLQTFCAVHDEETRILAQTNQLTRSAAGIRLAWQKFGNEALVVIGDAPTAVEEAIRLVKENKWRPHIIIGLPVGFVGTEECKEKLRRCLQVPRMTNRGTRGGSPWAAAVINAVLIHYVQETYSSTNELTHDSVRV